MKKLFLFLLFITCMSYSHAQKWAPMGAQWTYIYHSSISDFKKPALPVKWVADDTVRVNGKWCAIIHSPDETKPFDSFIVVSSSSFTKNILAVYQDSGRLYWYCRRINGFTVLYDFNKVAGESWTVATPYCDVTVTVQKTGIDTINGIPLRSMVIKGGYASAAFSGKVIEYIGYLKAPRPIYPYACSAPTDLTLEFDTLRCYQDDYIGFVDFKTAPYCDYVKTSVNEYNQSSPEIKLYPNPSSNYFELEYRNEDHSPTIISITDISGRTLAQYPLPQGKSRIDAQAWASGLYFYSIRQGAKTLYNGKLIKQ